MSNFVGPIINIWNLGGRAIRLQLIKFHLGYYSRSSRLTAEYAQMKETMFTLSVSLYLTNAFFQVSEPLYARLLILVLITMHIDL